MFGSKDRLRYTARVHYYGDVIENEAVGELDIRAWVEAPEPPEIHGRNALAPLVALAAPYNLLLNATAEPDYIYPAVDMLDRAAEALLEDEQTARSYTLHGEIFNLVDPSGSPTEAAIPSAVPEPKGKAPRMLDLSLMENKETGGIWSRSRAPEEGGQPYFANSGLMLLLQHVAHNCKYESAVVPMAAGLGAFVEQFRAIEQVQEQEGITMNESSWAALGQEVPAPFMPVITQVVFFDDPRQELATFKAAAPGGS